MFYLVNGLERKAQQSPIERFLDKVEYRGFERCWIWTAALTKNGYGLFYLDGKYAYAHRLAYNLSVGDIPVGLHIDHLCRNRACVNPLHLEAVSQEENNRRGRGFAGLNAQKTHCVKGHELTILKKSRGCRICSNEREKLRKRRVRAAVQVV